MFKLDLEKAEEPEIKFTTSTGSSKKQESSRKTFIFALLTMPKPLTVWITTNWKILQEMGIPDHLTCLLRNIYASQEARVRTGCGTTDWSKLGKEYIKAVYCHPAYLTYRQSSFKFSSVTQSCLTLCDPMNRSTPGLHVHHKLPESAQTHVH